eukprot:7512329-Alexandrium_andersonii.AAC.1
MQHRFKRSKLELRGSRKDLRVDFLSCRRVHPAPVRAQNPMAAARSAGGHARGAFRGRGRGPGA